MALDGKIAVVTGGAAGIGKTISTLFAEEGAIVTVADRREDLAKQTADELASKGFDVDYATADVSIGDQVDQMMKSIIDKRGGIDILINNAGVSDAHSLLETSEEEWDTIMGINLKGNFLCSRAAARHMISRGRGGRIISTVSTAASNARPGAAAYCASKAGLVQFTKVLALELGEFGITANAVGPGMTLTESPIRDNPTDEYQKAFVGQVPAGRAGQPIDVARAMAFLASPEAEYINGQILYVDGGYSAGKFSVRG